MTVRGLPQVNKLRGIIRSIFLPLARMSTPADPALAGAATRLSMLITSCLQCPGVHSVQVMTQLEELDMSDSLRLEALPATLGLLAKLQRLDISDCVRLKRLPPSLGNLKSLR